MIKVMRKVIPILLLIVVPTQIMAAINWNENEINWHGYSDGLEVMQNEKKMGLVVVYSNRCGTCIKYARMFFSPDVVKLSKNIVLIKIDRDNEKSLSAKFDVDGNYVPRTFLLNYDGSAMPSPFKSEKYKYYLPPHNEKYLADIMRRLSNY